MSVHFSNKTDQWATPQATFDQLSAEFGPFDVDVCAIAENAKVATYYTPEQDGLQQQWSGKCWMNPPYGREIDKWVAKARRHSEAGDATVVCLLPARTDTAWWHDNVSRAAVVRFIRGRLKFGAGNRDAPFPSAIVVFAATRSPRRPAPKPAEQPQNRGLSVFLDPQSGPIIHIQTQGGDQ